MGHLSSVQYGFHDNEPCSKCGMKEKKGCCETEYKLVKVQDAHELAKTTFDFNQFTSVTLLNHEISVSENKEQSFLSLQYHSPPDPRINSVYLHNCVFRI